MDEAKRLDKEKELTKESKYIQQHLANERTYLAWIRTAIAVIGIGFLAASLHFNTPLQQYLHPNIPIFIAMFSLFIGTIIVILSSFIYFRNRRNINTQTFHSSFKIILFLSMIIGIIFIFLAAYYLGF